jgi:hypothetical protein
MGYRVPLVKRQLSGYENGLFSKTGVIKPAKKLGKIYGKSMENRWEWVIICGGFFHGRILSKRERSRRFERPDFPLVHQ